MPARQFDLPKCSYIGLKGVCGKPCIRGICGRHRDRKSLPLCNHCGVRGTKAKHGYCSNAESGCFWKGQYRYRVLKSHSDLMEDYITDLIESFDPSKITPRS